MSDDTEQVEVEVIERHGDGHDEIVVDVTDRHGDEVTVVVEEDHDLPILIEVNRKPVAMEQRSASGLEIKAAAIAQGVQIELDFVLAVRRHGRTDPIKDKEVVRLHPGECFVANAADDNS